jgi:hypothetical protein
MAGQLTWYDIFGVAPGTVTVQVWHPRRQPG